MPLSKTTLHAAVVATAAFAVSFTTPVIATADPGNITEDD